MVVWVNRLMVPRISGERRVSDLILMMVNPGGRRVDGKSVLRRRFQDRNLVLETDDSGDRCACAIADQLKGGHRQSR